MNFKTSISKVADNDTIIHGEKLSDLVASRPFSDTAFLLVAGRLPDEKESKLFAAMLTSVVDHGMGTASSMATRFVASTGNDLNAAVAAGVLALGKFHGGAIEAAMRQFLRMNEGEVEGFVIAALAEKETLYGFGHRVYKDYDPRVKQLHDLCRELKYKSEFLNLAFAAEKAIENTKGKRLVLNVDGFIAAVLCEMGVVPEAGNGVFLIARLPGLVAQAVEERVAEKPVRRIDEASIEYLGK